MSSMRPWAHESELARFLDVQRSLSRARTPSTPTFPNSGSIGMPPDDDIRRVDEMLTALHSLKLRLSTNQEMADHASHILDYLTDLRADFPIPSPERAFSRLQPLRDLIFWLPPGVLRAGESDLAALTLLSHLYATALVVEGLFPEIGASYLGVMCLPPLERIHEILTSRRAAQPADSGCQVALQIVEYPMRVVATYKATQRQRQLSNSTTLSGEHHHHPAYAAHRGSTHSPHHSPYMGSGGTHHLGLGASGGSPGEQVPNALYGASPVQTPQVMSASAPGAYFTGSGQSAQGGAMGSVRRGGGGDSPSIRPPSLGERSASMSLVYGAGAGHHQQNTQPSQPPTVRSSHEADRLEYFGGAAAYQQQQHHQQGQGPQSSAYYAGMGAGAGGGGGHFSHHHHHNRFVAPSQLWT